MTFEILKYKYLEEAGDDGGQPDNSNGGEPDGGGSPSEGSDGGQQPSWPDDWRNQFAGELSPEATPEEKEAHEKALKQLTRFSSPSDVYKSFREAQQKISANTKVDLPENPSEEEITAYREANGIPAEPDGYYETFGDLQVGEEDKPFLDEFIKSVAHPNNWKPEDVKAAYEFDRQSKEAQMAQYEQQNDDAYKETEAHLKEKWGNEYDGNVTMVNNLISLMGEEAAEIFHNVRTSEGIGLLNHPSVAEAVLSIAKEVNPIPSSVGGSGANEQSIGDELRDIEKVMTNNRSAYNKDNAMQERYRDLLVGYKKVTGKDWGRG